MPSTTTAFGNDKGVVEGAIAGQVFQGSVVSLSGWCWAPATSASTAIGSAFQRPVITMPSIGRPEDRLRSVTNSLAVPSPPGNSSGHIAG
jgi:hypothetical protein